MLISIAYVYIHTYEAKVHYVSTNDIKGNGHIVTVAVNKKSLFHIHSTIILHNDIHSFFVFFFYSAGTKTVHTAGTY